MKLKTNAWYRLVVVVILALLLVPVGIVSAAPGGIKGPPSGGEETATNSLSVPAIFVPSVGVGTPTCTAGIDTVLPDPAEVSTVFPGYWVQGEASWQADCNVAPDHTLAADLDWGDNLVSAPLKQRTPIRVEVGLLADDVSLYTMTGFGVDKLTPDLLDRYATYGTNDGSGIPNFSEVRIWNAGATLNIKRDSDGLVVYNGAYTAEINSTGKVVYGYNWQKPLPGTYTITFRAPTVTLVSQDAPTGALVVDTDGHAHIATIKVNVSEKAGGGGGGGGPRPR